MIARRFAMLTVDFFWHDDASTRHDIPIAHWLRKAICPGITMTPHCCSGSSICQTGRKRTFAHHAIQANASGHLALEIRPSMTHRISSTYHRHRQWHIERYHCRLKGFRRIATLYDKLAGSFLSSVCLVAAVVCWI
jgi:hypothetical protein